MADLNEYAEACEKHEKALNAMLDLAGTISILSGRISDSWQSLRLGPDDIQLPAGHGAKAINLKDWPTIKQIADSIREAQTTLAEAKAIYDALSPNQRKVTSPPGHSAPRRH
jgi:hypothetical protein